jgi:hypothetical protein
MKRTGFPAWSRNISAMKNLVAFVFLLMIFSFRAQPVAGTFDEISKSGKRISQLDSAYKSALHSNPELAVFSGKEDAFYKAYVQMLRDLATFLKTRGFKWEQQTRSFTRIYFKSDGHIDYFLYHFKEGQISDEKRALFDKHLKEFVKEYRLGMNAAEPFAQCSPSVFKD